MSATHKTLKRISKPRWTLTRLALVTCWPLLCVLLGILMWVLAGSHLEHARLDAAEQARRQVSANALAYAQFLDQALGQEDQFLRLMRRRQNGQALDLSLAQREGAFPANRKTHASILDRQGYVITATFPWAKNSFSYRDYFQFHLTHAEDVLHIGAPFIGKNAIGDNPVIIQASRRVAGPGNRFDGVATISLRPAFFAPIGTSLTRGESDAYAVIGTDGVLRYAMLRGRELNPLSSGFLSNPEFKDDEGVMVSAAHSWIPDQEKRLLAWKKLDGFGLFAVASVPESLYLADYQNVRKAAYENLRNLTGLLIALALIGGWLAAYLVERNHHREINRMSYRIATDGGKDAFFMFAPIRDAKGKLYDLRYLDCNTRAAEMLATRADLLIGKLCSQFWPPEELSHLLTIYERAGYREFLDEETQLGPQTPYRNEIEWVRRRVVRTNDLFSVVISDITDEHRLRAELLQKANEDALTATANRNWLIHALPKLIDTAKLTQTRIALLYLDFDKFKKINDLYGHSVGDEILQQSAARLKRVIRPRDEVVHLAGDEFLVLLHPAGSHEAVQAVAERILETFEAPFQTSKTGISVSISIGIAIFPLDGLSADALLGNADAAMYQAKANGCHRFLFYEPWIYEATKTKLELEQAIERAFEHNEFFLQYQPRFSAHDTVLVGFEALVRWNRPKFGVVKPNDFIPLAEENGQIVRLGAIVLEQACAQLGAWRERGLPCVPVSVNVSARQFASGGVKTLVEQALQRHKLPTRLIEIEVTESSIFEQDVGVYEELTELRRLGVKILLDDFGTGYSSLSQLQGLDLDVLKIDKSFIAPLGQFAERHAIVNAIISMAHALGISVVAEGVETVEQLQVLRQLGCDEIQGYFFAKPLLPADAEKFMTAQPG
jgi:diguanylate cyclase (GGDEF)-like protein